MNNLISSDAEVLLSIKENENFGSKFSVIELILSDMYLTRNNLNASLNRLFSAGLIDFCDDNVVLTDKAKVLTCGYLYSKRNAFLEKLKTDITTIVFTDYIEKNFVSVDRYKFALKISKKLKSKTNTDKTLYTEILSYLCYVLIMFFFGFGIGFIFGGNVLGGLFIVPVAFVISLVLYIKTKAKINSQKGGFDVFSLVKKPIIISIVVHSFVATFSIVAFVIFDVSYFIALLIEIVVISALWVYTSNIAKDKISKGNYKTKYFQAKIYTNSYYIGGINILDENARILQENVNISIINPETNNVLYETNNVYKIVIKGRQIFYATVSIGNSTLIYFLRKIDLLSAIHLIEEIDFVLTANSVKAFLSKLVKNEDKPSFICQYSQDGLVRAYSCILEGKKSVVIEFFDYTINENSNSDYSTWLTDDVLCNPNYKTSWSRVWVEAFNEDEYADEYLSKVLLEISFEDVAVNLLSPII